jgi:hypothetical protein
LIVVYSDLANHLQWMLGITRPKLAIDLADKRLANPLLATDVDYHIHDLTFEGGLGLRAAVRETGIAHTTLAWYQCEKTANCIETIFRRETGLDTGGKAPPYSTRV